MLTVQTAWKQKVLISEVGLMHPNAQSSSSLLGNFKLNWALCFLLHDDGSRRNMLSESCLVDSIRYSSAWVGEQFCRWARYKTLLRSSTKRTPFSTKPAKTALEMRSRFSRFLGKSLSACHGVKYDAKDWQGVFRSRSRSIRNPDGSSVASSARISRIIGAGIAPLRCTWSSPRSRALAAFALPCSASLPLLTPPCIQGKWGWLWFNNFP